MRDKLLFFLPLIATVFLVFLPLAVNPNLFLGRGNDLTEFFWPIIHYVKNEILINKEVPLWNNLFFAGAPLLPDPQNPTWYLPNATFLILPTDTAFLFMVLVHSAVAAGGAYLLARALGFSKFSSLFVACLFAASPKFSGFLEAGHYGLVIAYSWLPFIALAIHRLAKSATIGSAILLAVSFSSIYFNHLLTALLVVPFGIIFFLSIASKRNIKMSLFLSLVSVVFGFGLIAIAFLPQTEWQPQTTRELLVKTPDVYPKWTSKGEFLISMVAPWYKSKPSEIDTEKWIPLGVVPISLAIIGFLKLKSKYKVILLTVTAVIILIASNNASPFYDFLIQQKWYALLRVATRVWFPILLSTIFLAGYGLQYIPQKLVKAIFVVAIIESVLLGYFMLSKPISLDKAKATGKVFEAVKSDGEIYRVMCTTRCLSQKESAKYNLFLAEGYGTLQQKNYYSGAQQIFQAFWDKYSLSIPPFDIYLFQKLKPHPPTLALYDIKYVISPYPLSDKNLKLVNTIDSFYVYENTLFRQKDYLVFKPNFIRVAVPDNSENRYVLSQIYNPGWEAYLNGKEKVVTSETHERLIAVDITENTRFIDFVYKPKSFTVGALITLFTVLVIVYLLLRLLSERKTRALLNSNVKQK